MSVTVNLDSFCCALLCWEMMNSAERHLGKPPLKDGNLKDLN